VALGLMGGILSGADKLSRVAYLHHDPAIAEVLGIEAVASQLTFSRFLNGFDESASQGLNDLHRWAVSRLPSLRGGYTLDLDSWSLLHEEGHQEGVLQGYTPKGLEPCHRPLIACLAEPKLVAGFWLRPGNAQCPERLHEKVLQTLEARSLHYIVVMKLYKKWQKYCCHCDAAWTPTDVPGLEVQEIEGQVLGRRMLTLRQRISERPQASGKELLEVPSCRFQALVANLPGSWSALAVWRRYDGRAESENRLKELGRQFGIKGFCCKKFWATQAVCQLAIWAYNLCILVQRMQRELGLLEKVQLQTLRWRLFCRAGVWS
jgi:hypothetical protein